MSSPTVKPEEGAPTLSELLEEPAVSGTAATAVPPLPLGAAEETVRRTFICWTPAVRASWSLPQDSKASETEASVAVRTWVSGMAGAPAARAEVLVPETRVKPEHQPRSSHGAGGAAGLKEAKAWRDRRWWARKGRG